MDLEIICIGRINSGVAWTTVFMVHPDYLTISTGCIEKQLCPSGTLARCKTFSHLTERCTQFTVTTGESDCGRFFARLIFWKFLQISCDVLGIWFLRIIKSHSMFASLLDRILDGNCWVWRCICIVNIGKMHETTQAFTGGNSVFSFGSVESYGIMKGLLIPLVHDINRIY